MWDFSVYYCRYVVHEQYVDIWLHMLIVACGSHGVDSRVIKVLWLMIHLTMTNDLWFADFELRVQKRLAPDPWHTILS